ncbi:MAG TPA: ferritin-like domain-containing protein [Polyangiaceae bacterium]
MKNRHLRSDVRVLAGALFASLGMTPVACGGQSLRESGDGSGDDGGTSSGGSGVSTGGLSTGGISTGGSGNEGPTGGTTPAGASGTTSTGGTPPINRFPCENPVEVGAGTSGFVRCENGAKHRSGIETCFVSLPRSERLPPGGACTSDLDCGERPYGFCGPGRDGEVAYVCYSGCATDADCDDGQICECGEFVGTCVEATCRSDGDCEAGFLCQSHDLAPGCDVPAYACQRPGDTCGGNADCDERSRCYAGNGTEPRICQPMNCEPGRPFLVAGTLRTAPSAPRPDWRGDREWLDVSALSLEVREHVGHFYAGCAALEHASIAAFARFSLELLGVGAPPEFVAETTRAMRDETEHAMVMYGLASHFLGRSLGPGCLAIEGALDATTLEELALATLEELALATFVEGALGETLGALELHEASLHASDPAVRDALRRIASDETRHAALAFRFVAWALERSSDDLPRRLATALDAARRELDAVRHDGGGGGDLSSFGVLSDATRRAVRREALEHAVVPCFEELVGRVRAGKPRGAQALSSV